MAPCSTAILRVYLEGPLGLLSHDTLEITVSIRNDNPHRGNGPQLAGTATPEQVRAHIWGPWKFSADGRDETGRAVAPQHLAVCRRVGALRPDAHHPAHLVDEQHAELAPRLRE
ncbi:hypothetical protein [Streptomyces sp. NBC_00145]|uniref:hypothetical protein n=1 Tax=Streptomyces sp. NBC_00145 TaxID=2975666 RepID=UPI002E1975F9